MSAIIVDHTCISEFNQITSSAIDQIQDNYSIFYGHTSHGRQLVVGMEMLRAENSQYTFNTGGGTLQMFEIGDDLGSGGDTSWAAITRSYLDNPSNDFNIVIWSWCGGASYTNQAGIQAYLDKYTELENQYPNVTFIYMTGHLDGTGEGGGLWQVNSMIRSYCATNDKVLFDFADIESYDPDGNYYINEDDTCGWCHTWCETHSCPTCDICPHSHCFNCYQKGKGIWWMLARLTGWTPVLDVGDDEFEALPETIRLEQNYPNPFNPGTTIDYSLGARSEVTIIVYNLLGEKVRILEAGHKSAGTYTTRWDGTDLNGKPVASGVYFYLLQTDTYSETRKMVLQK